MNQQTNIVVNGSFKIVKQLSVEFQIDESHALKHSIEVFNFAKRIYNSELDKNPYLQNQYNIIVAAAILHDMCDHKYISEEQGIDKIRKLAIIFLTSEEIDIIVQIITSMSYSKVKKYGYPDLGDFQTAYNIVREADLLAAYDIHRCILYSMYKSDKCYTDAVVIANNLFNIRVLNYRKERLFVTDCSKRLSKYLHYKALKQYE